MPTIDIVYLCPLNSECCKIVMVQVLFGPPVASGMPSRAFMLGYEIASQNFSVDHFCLAMSKRLAIIPKTEMQCRPMQR